MRLPFIFGLIASALAIAFCAASCSSNPEMPGTDAATAPDASTAACPNGYSQCGSDCFALKRDPTNCGACGKACKAGEVCVQGGCALQCAGGASKCGAVCANTKSDPNNCGMCGLACPTGQVCSLGKCAVSCAQGLTDCSGACVDLQSDDDNCGACANACSPGQKCTAGKCVATCQAGWTSCPDGDGGTICVDLTTDNSNCGMCGTACKNGEFCSPGADGGPSTCGLACFGGTTKCGNKCVDLAIDPQNCGACNVPCNGTCFGGMCCSGNLVWCGACTNLKTDANNCGACGNKCGGICNNGVCCTQNEIICNGKCTDTQNDSQNCNGCGNVCPMNNPVCSGGVCTNIPSTCKVVNGITWCQDTVAGRSCNTACNAVGYGNPAISDNAWLAAQDTQALCTQIGQAFGLSFNSISSYSYGCAESSNGSIICSTFNGCPTDHRTMSDSSPWTAICPCN